MDTGQFKAAFDGYSGHIEFIGQPAVAVAIVPSDKPGAFMVLLAGKTDTVPFKIGTGHVRRGKKSLMQVQLDSPLLKSPVQAVMALKADRDGHYFLRWER